MSKYFIFTARETQNAKVSNREYKLLIPVNFVALKDNLKEIANIPAVIPNGQNSVRFSRSSREMPSIPGESIMIMHLTNGKTAESLIPRNLQSFLLSVSMKVVILTWQACLDNLNKDFQRLTNRSLFPTFAYEHLSGFQRIEMSTVPSKLGYEGTPIMPQDAQRLRNMSIVQNELQVYWPHNYPNPTKRLQNLAILIESHVFLEACKVPNFLNSPQHRQVLLKIKNMFLTKKDELRGLMNYPDIMYQFMVNSKMIGLRTSSNSIAVVTSNPALSCRTPSSSSTSTTTLQQNRVLAPNVKVIPAASSSSRNPSASYNITWTPPPSSSTVHHLPQTSQQLSSGSGRLQATQSHIGVIVNPTQQKPTTPTGDSLLKKALVNPVPGDSLLKKALVIPVPGPTKESIKLKTPFSIFAALRMKKHLPGLPPLKISDIQKEWEGQTPEVQLKYKVVAEQLNQKARTQLTNNMTTNMINNSKQAQSARGSSWVCPFYPSHCSVAAPFVDTTALLRHLNNAHFSVSVWKSTYYNQPLPRLFWRRG